MTKEQIEKERAAFEEWVGVEYTLKNEEGYYISKDISNAFNAWLAAKRHAEQITWIPITEKYPEEQKQEVIVKLADGTVRIALYSRHTPSNQDDPLHYFEGDLEHVDGWRYHAINFENVEYWKPLSE